MIFFVPTSIVAIIIVWRAKLIKFKVGITVAVAGVIGAGIGASLSVRTDVDHLRKYFGIFLVLITIYEIYYVIKKYIFDKKKA